jgi:hypothetical protein
MTERLGNTYFYEVKEPDEQTKQRTQQWLSSGVSNALPSEACHLVLLNTFCFGKENVHFSYNLIEVTVLKEQGTELFGWEKAYFHAHDIRDWLKKYCTNPQRKRHYLSSLRQQTQNQMS